MASTKNGLFIFGLSTTAKSVFAIVKKYKLFNIKGFLVDSNFQNTSSFCDIPVYGLKENKEIININKETDQLFIAIQWNKVNEDRRKVYESLKSLGYKFANIISPNAIIHGAIIGDNCWIADGAIIDTNSKVGSNVFVKSNAFVGNDCIIENHCFIGAGSFIAGDCTIGEQSFIGIKSTIFDNVKIGKKCIIGACSIVNRNVDDFSLIKTNLNNTISIYDSVTIESKLNYKQNIR